MKVVGYARSNFMAKDSGNEITGYNIYITSPINPTTGKGVSCDRIYLTDAKLAASNVDIAGIIGREVTVYFNRYGKPMSISVQN